MALSAQPRSKWCWCHHICMLLCHHHFQVWNSIRVLQARWVWEALVWGVVVSITTWVDIHMWIFVASTKLWSHMKVLKKAYPGHKYQCYLWQQFTLTLKQNAFPYIAPELTASSCGVWEGDIKEGIQKRTPPPFTFHMPSSSVLFIEGRFNGGPVLPVIIFAYRSPILLPSHALLETVRRGLEVMAANKHYLWQANSTLSLTRQWCS